MQRVFLEAIVGILLGMAVAPLVIK